MRKSFTRRDFLKLIALIPWLKLALPPRVRRADATLPNILFLVFDTYSAEHCSLYGYPRQTAPNLIRFAEQATTYHNHYSAGNHTSTGTSSLLTGAYPWSHRCYHPYSSTAETFVSQNLFSVFPDHYRLGFSHNLLVNIQLHRFIKHLDEFVLPGAVALIESEFSDDFFPKDYGISVVSERALLEPVGARPNSLFGYLIKKVFQDVKEEKLLQQLKDIYPRGIPNYHGLFYRFEDSIDWAVLQAESLAQPYLAYIHMLPPHTPYTPRREFVDIFLDDGLVFPEKPEHFFTEGRDHQFLEDKRRYYNEYIAYVDSEIGRLLSALERAGTFENTWVIITSDHGELFERGIFQHVTPVLYQSLVRVPLLIHAPGQEERVDVYSTTSSVDVLPTLLHEIGYSIPAWVEGKVLPPYNANMDDQRSIFAMDAKPSSKFRPLNKATFMMVKGCYKLIYYRGYTGFDEVFELYDLENDPQELNDLASSKLGLLGELVNELKTAIAANDLPG